MQQLSGLDSSFLNMETATTYGHVSGLAIFDPKTASRPSTLDDVKQLIEERIHLLPPYRRELMPDVWDLMDHLSDSLEELKGVVKLREVDA